MYRALFDADGVPLAFYPSSVWPEGWPEDAVEITEEQWQEFISNQGTRRYVNGAVVEYLPPAPPPPPPYFVVGSLWRALTDEEWDDLAQHVAAEHPRIQAMWGNPAERVTEDHPLWPVIVGRLKASLPSERVAHLLEVAGA